MNIRQKLLLEFKKGKQPYQLIKEKVASRKTIYNVWHQYCLYKFLCVILWNIVYENRIKMEKDLVKLVNKVVQFIK